MITPSERAAQAARTGRDAIMAGKSGKTTTRKAAPKAAPAVKKPAAKKPAAPKAAKPAAAEASRTPPPPRPDYAATPDPAAFLSSEQRQTMERLSTNLARAAVTAQGAIAEAALRQADSPAALSTDPFHVAPALTDVMSRLAAQPDRLLRAQADLFSRYLDLWQTTTRRMGGEQVDPVIEPP